MAMLQSLHPEAFRAVRDVFARARYDADGLAGCLGTIRIPTHPGRELPHFLHLTRRETPIDLLIRLFLIGTPVAIEAARKVLSPVPIETWTRAGLLELNDGFAAGLVKMMPYQDLLFAVDQTARPEVNDLPDQVMGLTASTTSVASYAIRRPSRHTLDLGTGCGIQALLASRHSDRVTAIDVSDRALCFARFNAGLNNCGNIRFLQGDGFEPVCGDQFDLIVSNPPFAVSPGGRYLYRDSGMPGDQFCRRIIKQAPAFLSEGGYCQITCDWMQVEGQDWKDRLSEWCEGSGCDMWVMRVESNDPAGYTHMWIRDTEHDDAEQTARRYQEWISWFEREKVQSIHTGLIAIRRTAGGKNWVRMEDAPELASASAGSSVALGFALEDFLQNVSDEKLLENRLSISPDAHLTQQCEWSDGKWQISTVQVRLKRGLEFAGNVDRNGLALISKCDGRRTLCQVIEELAAELKADAARVIPPTLPLVRKLIERGYLLPPEIR